MAVPENNGRPSTDDILYLVKRFTSAIEELTDAAKTLSSNFETFNRQMQSLLALTATERAAGQITSGLLKLLMRRRPDEPPDYRGG